MSKVTYANHIETSDSILIWFNGREDPVPVSKQSRVFPDLVRAIRSGEHEQVPVLADQAFRIAQMGDLRVEDGLVYIGKDCLPATLSKRLIQLMDHDLNIDPLINFWFNLRKNPSKSSREELFDFLEANHVPLTEDGCFVGYKKIRSDFTDSYTGTISNKVGSVVKMDRAKVDANRNVTCSTGLHVAAYNYANGFDGNILVEIKVNPQNVVSVPTDYDNQKMRVCEYEVIRVSDGYMDSQVYDREVIDEDLEDEIMIDDAYELDDDDEDYDFYDDDEDYDFYDDDEDYDFYDDDHVEDDELIEISSTPDKPKIVRIPARLSELQPSTDGRVRVSLELLDKIGVESGDTIYAVVPSKRARKVVLTMEEPDSFVAMKSIKVGTASVRLPASIFSAAGIFSDEYKIGASKGTLEIRSK